ncbi:MAG TPA: S-adenosylmethionine:tRNA ribosyltransferase-isomerase [Bacteroidales bacterium]|nr:S-adenosylmethionine:tRNA ribosyltransferase-isomerase [Bacteroidales bacterium]HPS27351.1 S-adenosylmethionine:tRNA ribosyltransferase-isomerase [Bacteroidales bacterium]
MQHFPSINISEYDYPLPDERIALYPLPVRDTSKLLCFKNGVIADKHFYDLPDLLAQDTLLVGNNTRVIHARMKFRKETGAKIEIFCLEPLSPVSDVQLAMQQTGTCTWKCLVGNAKKWKGEKLYMQVGEGHSAYQLWAALCGRENETFLVQFSWLPEQIMFSEVVETAGSVPLPPYINRPAEQSDNERYQTVYARNDGSVAAPTAGLHFTPAVLQKLSEKNIATTYTTLHVGAGTFRPVQSDSIEQHVMHAEQVVVSKKLLTDLLSAKGPLIAVGTTTVRSLESLFLIAAKRYLSGRLPQALTQWEPYNSALNTLSRDFVLNDLFSFMENSGLEQVSFSTSIIILPGYQFKITDGMVTNFHQPRSTLLLLVSAMLGDDWKKVYEHALQSDYRFLSYGDACLFLK